MVQRSMLFSIRFIEQDTEQQRKIPPGKSFAEIRSKRSAFPKVKLCHCRLESQSLGWSPPLVRMPALAVLGDHTGEMTPFGGSFLHVWWLLSVQSPWADSLGYASARYFEG